MMKPRIFLLSTLIFLSICSEAQKAKKSWKPMMYGGIGAGLDFGGIGFKVEYLPVKNVGVFAGAGFNFDGLGYNGGLSWKITPNKSWTPTLMAMYGYNAVLKITQSFGYAAFTKTYYDPSVGAGFDFNVGRKTNKVSVAVLVPFRNNEFKEKYNVYKESGYNFNPDILPITLSIGINVGG